MIRRLTRQVHRAFRSTIDFQSLPSEQLFPQELVVHFSYHKCMTVYYKRIMEELSAEFGFYTQHFDGVYEDFEEAALNGSGKKVISVNNRSDIAWRKLPSHRGSHFVRDPRDLVVSGYYYHLWSEEAHLHDPSCHWPRILKHPYFAKYVESNPKNSPKGVSYQDYLRGLDRERGLILEIIWRDEHFAHMKSWDYQNPQILEVRYEDVIGNEAVVFWRMFEHYRFHPRLIERGVEIADQLSLENLHKSKAGHVRSGKREQWREEFTPLVSTLFKEGYGDLLVELGYEVDQAC